MREYNEAIRWFERCLRFRVVEDTRLGPGRRWVVVEPERSGTGAALLLARASDERQHAALGNQFGGRVGFFLHTSDFAQDHAAMTAAGVRFREPPRRETYGRVAVFEDLYGNPWDLLEPASPLA